MKNGGLGGWVGILPALFFIAFMITGCATARPDPFEARLAAMSADELVSYYHGINDRIKQIQANTRDMDQQGIVSQEDQIAKMPYLIGGEAWGLEKKQTKVRKELARRDIRP